MNSSRRPVKHTNFSQDFDELGSESFNSSVFTSGIFQTKLEGEIPLQINDLSNMREVIEEELREKVADHYPLFLHVSGQINSIENDVVKAKDEIKLVGDILNEYQEIVSCPIQEVTPLKMSRSSSFFSPDQEVKREGARIEGVEEISFEGLSSNWVESAPYEMRKLLAERRFQEATDLVLRLGEELEGVGREDESPKHSHKYRPHHRSSPSPKKRSMSDSLGEERWGEILGKMRQLEGELVISLQQSLQSISVSPVFN